jgi:hypothetical protein
MWKSLTRAEAEWQQGRKVVFWTAFSVSMIYLIVVSGLFIVVGAMQIPGEASAPGIPLDDLVLPIFAIIIGLAGISARRWRYHLAAITTVAGTIQFLWHLASSIEFFSRLNQ